MFTLKLAVESMFGTKLFFSKHGSIPDHPVENLSTHRESMGSMASKIIMTMKLAYGPHRRYIKSPI